MSHPLNFEDLNARLEALSARDILLWAEEVFGEDLVVSSSFQTQSVPLLHMIGMTVPKVPILFLDTGFHFPETLAFRDRLQREFNLNIVDVHPGKDENFAYSAERGPYLESPRLLLLQAQSGTP